MKQAVCDICGAVGPIELSELPMTGGALVLAGNGQRFDLCPKCFEILIVRVKKHSPVDDKFDAPDGKPPPDFRGPG